MRFLVQIANRKFILDAKRVESLITALDGAEQIENKWVGKTAANSNGYVPILSCSPLSEVLNFAPVTDDEYNTLKLVTISQQSA
jgi:hypothetical protein